MANFTNNVSKTVLPNGATQGSQATPKVVSNSLSGFTAGANKAGSSFDNTLPREKTGETAESIANRVKSLNRTK